MANRFWVGGTGNWNDTAHWSDSNGGAGGFSVPTIADDVVFNANSGAGTATINVAATCRSFTGTLSSIATLSHAAAVTLTIGDGTPGISNVALDLSGFTTYTLGNTTTSAITFTSTSATVQTVNTGGKTMGNMTFNGAGGSWSFAANCTMGSGTTFTLTAGTINLNGKTFAISNFNSNNSNTRAIIFGAASVTCSSGSTTGWDCTNSTNLTITPDTGTIYLSATTTNFCDNGGGGTAARWPTVVFNASNNMNTSVYDGARFVNLTILGGTTKNEVITLGSIDISGVFTATGNSAINRLKISSRGGLLSQKTITVNGSYSLSNTDFRDIAAAGTAGTWSGTSLGDRLGNSNITFTTATTRYWVGNTGNWSDTSHWSTTSGGASGASVPLVQDDAIFDANSFNTGSQIVTLDMPAACKTMDFRNVSNSPRLTQSTNSEINGNFYLRSGMTTTGSTGTLTLAGRGTLYIQTDGVTVVQSLTVHNYLGNTNQLGALTTTGAFAVEAGTYNSNSSTITCSTFAGANTSTARTFNLGTSTINMTSTAAGTIYIVSPVGTVTMDADEATFVITNASANSRTVNGRGHTYGTFTYTVAGSTGALVVDGSNTFTTFNFSDATNARTLTLTASTNNTFTNFNVMGASGRVVTLNSTSGTNHTITVASGIVSLDYLSISDSSATGGAYFAAGNNSTDAGGANTGWVFGAASFTKTFTESTTVHDATPNRVVNGNFDTAPSFTAPTTGANKYIDGTAAGSSTDLGYGWFNQLGGGSYSACFDTTEKISGTCSMKLVVSATGSYHNVTKNYTTNPLAISNGIPCRPSTRYKVTCWMKTQYVSGDSSNGAALVVYGRRADGSADQTNIVTGYIKTTTEWTKYVHTFTTTADAVVIAPEMRIYGHTGAATLIMTAWFDEIIISEDRPVLAATVAKSESSTITDNGIVKAIGKKPADTTNLTESIAKAIDKRTSDNVTITESVRKAVALPFSDSLTITETVTPNNLEATAGGTGLEIQNFAPSNVRETTMLTADVAAGVSSLPVKSIQNIAAETYALIGSIGGENSELIRVTGVSTGTITLASATVRAHNIFDQITILNANQINIYYAEVVDGEEPTDEDYTLRTSVDIDPDEVTTSYSDQYGNDNTRYLFRYYNSSTDIETRIDDIGAVIATDSGLSVGDYCTIHAIKKDAGLEHNRYIDDTDIEFYRKAAQGEIDANLNGLYTVPFTQPINPRIEYIAMRLASGMLIQSQYPNPSSTYYQEGEKKIADARLILSRINTKAEILVDRNGESLLIANNSSTGISGSFQMWPNKTSENASPSVGGGRRLFSRDDWPY